VNWSSLKMKLNLRFLLFYVGDCPISIPGFVEININEWAIVVLVVEDSKEVLCIVIVIYECWWVVCPWILICMTPCGNVVCHAVRLVIEIATRIIAAEIVVLGETALDDSIVVLVCGPVVWGVVISRGSPSSVCGVWRIWRVGRVC